MRTTFIYRYALGVVGSPGANVFGAAATSAALISTATSIASSAMVIEFDAEDLDISGVQNPFATLSISNAGSTGTVDAVAIPLEARFEQAVMPTAIPTS